MVEPPAPARKLPLGIVLMALILLVSTINAQESGVHNKFSVALRSGYVRENFSWSIAGKITPTNHVNVLSELDWKRLSGLAFHVDVEYNLYKRIIVRTNLGKVALTSGKVTDTDFGKDNRRDTLFFGSFRADKGNLHALNLAVGYNFNLLKSGFLSPLVGYGIDRQSLYILADLGNVTGDLKSTYRAGWAGLTFGYIIKAPIGKRWSFQHYFTYQQARYFAKGNWNLVDNFKHPVSFKHNAKGIALKPEVHVLLKISPHMHVSAGASYSCWKTGEGKDKLFLSNGSTIVTQFNGASRNSLTLLAGAFFTF
jgi:outer membrane protease